MRLPRRLLDLASPRSRRVLHLAMLSAGADAALAILFAHATYTLLGGGHPPASYLFAFAVLLLVGGVARNAFGSAASAWGSGTASRMRDGLIRAVAATEPAAVERIGAEAIEKALYETRRLEAAAHAAARIVYTGIAGVVVLVYIAWLSPLSLLITMTLLLLLGTAVALNLAHAGRSASSTDGRYEDAISVVLQGAEGLMLDPRKVNAVWEHEGRAGLVGQVQTALAPWCGHSLNLVLAAIGPLLIIAVMVLLLPWLTKTNSETAVGALLALSWIPVLAAIQGIPALLEGETAAEEVERIGADLEQAGNPRIDDTEPPTFHSLLWESVAYRHKDRDGRPTFALGPLSIAINSGELVIVTGPTGSGKTTLLRLLGGFYRPDQGRVLLNGDPAEPSQIRRFCTGIIGTPADAALLEEGAEQRFGGKREAMADALASIPLDAGAWRPSAPILFVDEPEREREQAALEVLFNRLLPSLTAQGYTVVVATRYEEGSAVADHLVQLDFGEVVAYMAREALTERV